MTNEMNTKTLEEMNAEAIAWLEENDTTLPRRENGKIFWHLIELLEKVEGPEDRARRARWEEQTRIAKEKRAFNEKVNVIARKQIEEFFANGTELTPIVDRKGNFLQ